MSPEKEELLNSKYPKILTGLSYGLACDDGWYDLIETLCGNIQHKTDSRQKYQKNTPQCKAVQVKEKFGGLRFYVAFESDSSNDEEDSLETIRFVSEIRGMISFAESMSYRICEACGSPGTLRQGGWHRTLCNACEEKR